MSQICILKRPAEDALLSQRKFLKKTARGKVVKGSCLISVCKRNDIKHGFIVLRERYLRNDVPCGIANCPACTGYDSLSRETGSLLPFDGGKGHKSYPNGHILLPDTNAFLHQVRLLVFMLIAEFTSELFV